MSEMTTEGAAPASVWGAIGSGVVAGGRAVGRGAAAVGRAVASFYGALDPDLKRHVVEAPLVGLTVLARPRREVEPLPDDGHRPVVLVHGLGGFPGNFFPLRSYLRLMGRRRTYAVPFPDGLTLDERVAHLRAFIAAVIERNGLPEGAQVDVVAHSLGGVLSRLAVQDPATAARVATLVTLGTPHAGTSLARFLKTPAVLALRPDSPTLERLREQLPWRAGRGVPRLVCLWSPADLLLHPPTAALVDGAENVEMPGFTHTSYLLHPRGFREIHRALAAP